MSAWAKVCLRITVITAAITLLGLALAYAPLRVSRTFEGFIYVGAPVSSVVAALAGLATMVAGVVEGRRRKHWSPVVLGLVALALAAVALAAGAWLRFAWSFGHSGQ